MNTTPKLPIGAFFDWWFASLLECAPRPITKLFENRQDRFIVAMDQQTATLYAETNDGIESLGEHKLTNDLNINNALPDNINLQDYEVVLRLPRKRVLSKVLELPDATADRLPQVLSLDMDRQTPFTKDQVYFSHNIVKRLPEKRSIQVKLAVIPKAKLDHCLERVSSWGLKPAVIDVVDEPGINLLPMEQRPKHKNTQRWINTGLFLLLIALLLTVVIVPLWQKRTQTIAWIAKSEQLRDEAKTVIKLRKKLDQATAASQFVVEKKLSAPTPLALLAELTEKFPDDTWSQQFEVKDREIRVRGESAKASGLIGLLENSALLKNVRFLSPVTTNPTTGRERYHLGADMVIKETTAEKKAKQKASKRRRRP